ncbi:hypothetical protein IWQ62_001341 [Dispira parvispora]|uniref:Carrier domain-containing protein n=1 Tax=Dispira parvispora TaxID=1520584 RepID=A0A9W8E3Z3_9FUNG|nr:hypothetical protein IWQ62_001341 [Dispira parvispora]
MVPDHIVSVDKLPLTINGKVDRQALLTNHSSERVQSEQISPSSLTTPMQQRLIAILCELFNLKQGEIRPLHDTFFTLGGNSISAMYFVSRCKANGIPLAMADINRRTTVAALAKCASEGAGEDNMNSISTECTHGPFSLTPVQRMYFSWDLVDVHHWPLPLLIKVTAPRTLYIWCAILTSLVSHHDMMRARFEQVNDEWFGQVLSSDDDPVEVVQVTLTNETDYWQVITEANKTMNITTGPIYLAYVMNYQDTQYLYLALHHLIADKISANLLAEDICTLLDDQPLPHKTMPYQVWSRNLESLRAKLQLDSFLLPNEDELKLPVGDMGGTLQNDFEQCHHCLSSPLDVSTTLALDEFGHRDTTAEDIILTGLLLAYTTVFNCTSIPLQYISHGRNALGNPWDVSRTVGFFINTCPIVLRRAECDDLQKLLAGVQSTL